MNDLDDDPLVDAARWIAAGRNFALATVTRTWGSAPRPQGSQMVVDEDGAFNGSVSGGCVETAVIAEAKAALEIGKSRNLTFGVSNDDAWAVGLACGGTIEINLVPVRDQNRRDTLSNLQTAREAGHAAVLATDLASGEMRLLQGDALSRNAIGQAAADALRQDQSGAIDIAGASWFLTVFNPPLDLVIVGAVHIAQALARMARIAGYDVRIIDPRTSFATPERFPDMTLVNAWPDEALELNPLTARSALVVLAHDPKLDDPALIRALNSPCFYIGALGSKATHTLRLERLQAQGASASGFTRIHGPIGLSIGARGTAEIAIAVMAEMTAQLRG